MSSSPNSNQNPKGAESNKQILDPQTIDKIAKLSRLAITGEQAQEYAVQLAQALSHFEKISQVPTAGIEPLVTPTEIENWTREDLVTNHYSAEEMTANAPDRIGHLLKVPPVV